MMIQPNRYNNRVIKVPVCIAHMLRDFANDTSGFSLVDGVS